MRETLVLQNVGPEVLLRGGGVLAHDVTTRRVLTDSVLVPGVVALDTSTAHLGGGLPEELSEVTGGFRETWVQPVVLVDFVVPSINRRLATGVASSQVLTVWTTGVDQLNVVAVKLLCVVGCVLSQSPVPCECRCTMQCSLLVCLRQNLTFEVVETVGWCRCGR